MIHLGPLIQNRHIHKTSAKRNESGVEKYSLNSWIYSLKFFIYFVDCFCCGGFEFCYEQQHHICTRERVRESACCLHSFEPNEKLAEKSWKKKVLSNKFVAVFKCSWKKRHTSFHGLCVCVFFSLPFSLSWFNYVLTQICRFRFLLARFMWFCWKTVTP